MAKYSVNKSPPTDRNIYYTFILKVILKSCFSWSQTKFLRFTQLYKAKIFGCREEEIWRNFVWLQLKRDKATFTFAKLLGKSVCLVA